MLKFSTGIKAALMPGAAFFFSALLVRSLDLGMHCPKKNKSTRRGSFRTDGGLPMALLRLNQDGRLCLQLVS